MPTEEGLAVLRSGPGTPWPDYDSTVPDPDFPKKGIATLTDLWAEMSVRPVDCSTPVIDPSTIEDDIIRLLLTIHIPEEPTYLFGSPEISPIRRMAAIFYAYKFRSMLQMRAGALLSGPSSTNNLVLESAKSFNQIDVQKYKLVGKWFKQLEELSPDEREAVERELKRMGAGWKQWAYV